LTAAARDIDHTRRFAFPKQGRERARYAQRADRICLERLSKQIIADFQNCIVSVDNDPCVVHEHIEVILDVQEFTRGASDAVIVGNVYFQKCRLARLLRDRVCRFATSLCIPRTDEHVKPFGRELSCDFVADAFVGAGNQHGFHVLVIGRVRITGLQKIL